jgi:hypothetical protein
MPVLTFNRHEAVVVGEHGNCISRLSLSLGYVRFLDGYHVFAAMDGVCDGILLPCDHLEERDLVRAYQVLQVLACRPNVGKLSAEKGTLAMVASKSSLGRVLDGFMPSLEEVHGPGKEDKSDVQRPGQPPPDQIAQYAWIRAVALLRFVIEASTAKPINE